MKLRLPAPPAIVDACRQCVPSSLLSTMASSTASQTRSPEAAIAVIASGAVEPMIFAATIGNGAGVPAAVAVAAAPGEGVEAVLEPCGEPHPIAAMANVVIARASAFRRRRGLFMPVV
jgi:hypothetical protein